MFWAGATTALEGVLSKDRIPATMDSILHQFV